MFAHIHGDFDSMCVPDWDCWLGRVLNLTNILGLSIKLKEAFSKVVLEVVKRRHQRQCLRVTLISKDATCCTKTKSNWIEILEATESLLLFFVLFFSWTHGPELVVVHEIPQLLIQD